MNEKKHIHLIGICGTAMASLAGMLKQRGFHVTGSDAAAYPPMSDFLRELDIPVAQPFDAKNLNPRPDLVVVGNALSRGNRSEEHTSELQSLRHLVCRLLLEKKNRDHTHLPFTAWNIFAWTTCLVHRA